MHNVFLSERSANDIDRRVEKILKDVDLTEPPLDLDVVRELLELDRAYYSASDSSAVMETVHRLKVAGKQVMKRPGLLWEAIQKLNVRALYVPDRKRILIDKELPSPKQRWGEAHEIGHSLLPWHEAVMHGDQKRTLSIACHQEIEAEANYAAGRLLFPRQLFEEQLFSSTIDFNHIRALGKLFKNSMTTTLWRAVEAMDVPACALVSQHPKREVESTPIRYFVRSRRFESEFGTIAAPQVFSSVKSYCYGNRGPIGRSEVVLGDTNADEHTFFFETFFNGHEALTLGMYLRANVTTVVG